MDKRIKIAIGAGLAIGVVLIAIRHKVKSQGYSHNKFLAKTFDVPYLEKMYQSIEEKNKNLADSSKENELTKDGITFNATGLDPNKPCGMGGTKCQNGKCIKGKCVQSTFERF